MIKDLKVESIALNNPDQFKISENEKIRHNIDNNFNQNSYELIQAFLDKINSLKVIRDNINNNQEILPPLRIFKPIPPPCIAFIVCQFVPPAIV